MWPCQFMRNYVWGLKAWLPPRESFSFNLGAYESQLNVLKVTILIMERLGKPVDTTVTSSERRLFKPIQHFLLDYKVPGTIDSFNCLSCNIKKFRFLFNKS